MANAGRHGIFPRSFQARSREGLSDTCRGAAVAAPWREMRPSHAPWPLLDTPRAVTQVAFECGFSDRSHFARWSKRAYGESPHRFRQRRRQAAALRRRSAPKMWTTGSSAEGLFDFFAGRQNFRLLDIRPFGL